MQERKIEGERIGKYEFLAPLSAGGMAELFLGAVRGPGGFEKYVVIKRILPDASGNDTFVKMFLDEARITAGFSHQGIAQVFDLGEDPGGLYVAMEFISGANLNQVFNACVSQQALLPIGFSVAVVHDCALALHYAHTYRKPSGEPASVIHRDVAQKNIMVSFDGQVKLLDFGIAKAKGALSRTKVGTVKGTTGYMSPEQVRGEELDGRSDVFSLGVVLWEMVTGERLFGAQTELEEMKLLLEATIRRPVDVEPAVPEALSEIVMRALARDRDERWPTAREFARALQSRCGDEFFDQEARAGFMEERFLERIQETQALLTPGAERSEEQIRRALGRERKGGEELPKTTARRKVKTGPAVPRARNGAAKAPPATKPQLDAEDALLVLQAQANALLAEPRREERTWTGTLVLVVLVVLAGLFAWKTLVEDRRPSSSGLQRFPGEPPEDEVEATNRAAVPSSADRPVPLKLNLPGPAQVLPAAAPELPTPADEPTRPTAASDASRARGGPGTATLALLPEATVLEGENTLGHGTMVSFTLPAGTHLLSVVGPDGAKRRLSLPVQPGKNRPLKFQVNDLPLQ